MALYLARDDGTGSFFPDRGFGHLFLIVNIDGGIGENDDPADPKGVSVTYARTDGGIPAMRIDTLANEIAPTDPNVDIIIFPVDGTFSLSDGTMITSAAGVAAPVGNAINPTAADIATFYDTSQCNGSGYWVDQDGGGQIVEPPEVILYHELSHCFHFSSGTTAATSADEEVAAEIDENDMRDQQGLPHRDVNSHNGGCGIGPTNCCIIASIATGSAFSQEVNRLRLVRDHMIRQTRVGDRFIDRLLFQYYAFSPEVCRAMAGAPDLREQIRGRWVVPLIFALELATYAGEAKFDPKKMGRKLDTQLADTRLDATVDLATARLLTGLVDAVLSGGLAQPMALAGPVAGLVPLMNDRLADAEHVRWALLRVVGIWARAAAKRLEGNASVEVGRSIRGELEQWLCDAPVDDIWDEIGPGQAEVELEGLGATVFVTEAARAGFAQRIAARSPRLSTVLENWVRAGIASERVGP